MFSLGDQKTASEGGRSAGEEVYFFSATDLRRDPSTLTFGSGFSFAGRSRNEGLGRSGKIADRKREIVSGLKEALQASRDPVPMTEGARNFRRRGANAHRSPWSLVKSQDVGPAKSGQLNDATCDGPSLGGFDPRCFLEIKSEKSLLKTRITNNFGQPRL